MSLIFGKGTDLCQLQTYQPKSAAGKTLIKIIESGLSKKSAISLETDFG